jgi:hypothetical protein
MGRLYYRDSFGRVRRDRRAGQIIPSGSGIPARFFVTALLALAAIVVLVSLIPLPARPSRKRPQPSGFDARKRHCAVPAGPRYGNSGLADTRSDCSNILGRRWCRSPSLLRSPTACRGLGNRRRCNGF